MSDERLHDLCVVREGDGTDSVGKVGDRPVDEGKVLKHHRKVGGFALGHVFTLQTRHVDHVMSGAIRAVMMHVLRCGHAGWIGSEASESDNSKGSQLVWHESLLWGCG